MPILFGIPASAYPVVQHVPTFAGPGLLTDVLQVTPKSRSVLLIVLLNVTHGILTCVQASRL
jgi:hypothetical protein